MRPAHDSDFSGRRRLRLPTTLAAALAMGLVMGAAGCADSGSDETTTAGTSGAAFPVTVGTVTLDEQPEQIVSLSPTTTEMLFAIGAGSQVVAVDDQSDYPDTAPVTDLSGFEPNAEAIASREPELVVLSSDTNNIVAQLSALAIPTYVAPSAQTLDDTYAQMLDLGELTGHPTEAEEAVAEMRSEIEEIVDSVGARSTTLTYFHELDPTLYTATSETFIGSVYSLLGLENIADAVDSGEAGGYPQLSAEALISADPDIIFLADTVCCQQTAETVKARAGYADLTAVTQNQIVELDDSIASRWGPRVVDFLRSVAEAVSAIPSE